MVGGFLYTVQRDGKKTEGEENRNYNDTNTVNPSGREDQVYPSWRQAAHRW